MTVSAGTKTIQNLKQEELQIQYQQHLPGMCTSKKLSKNAKDLSKS